MVKRIIYRITFLNHEKIYEIYAKYVNQSGLLGFVEVESLLFGEKSDIVIDPVEEHLKTEFANVERTYIPIHSVIRIDEVAKKGTSKITPAPEKQSNVTPFRTTTPFPGSPQDK